MRTILTLLTLALVSLLFNIAQAAPEEKSQEQKSLRELLVSSGNTIDVIPVGDYMTYIHQKITSAWRSSVSESPLSSELVSWCKELGGRLQVSSEDRKEWRDIKVNSSMKFTNPFDNKEYKFDTAYITEHYRCDGVFSVIKTYDKPVARFLYKNMTPTTAFIIEHKQQPILFKFKNSDKTQTLKRFLDASSFPAEGSDPVKLFGGRFLTWTSDYWAVFVYMHGLCTIYGGTPQDLIDRNDILYETTPLEAFNYLGNHGAKWIFLCKNSKTPSGRFMAKIITNRGSYKGGFFTGNPPMEGLNYIPMENNADQAVHK